jgi:CO/xanthine dehydrogenase Mo-binding subunit
MGGAIANAVFDATGARLFRLPMTPARVKAAIGGA